MPIELTILLTAALVAGVWLLVRQQAYRTRLMEHRERLAAIEHGETPQPKGDPSMTTETLTPQDAYRRQSQWVRLIAFGLGLLLMFGGTGLFVGFLIIADPELEKLWSIGLVPMMAGFGLLLFSLVARRLFPGD